MKNKLIIVMALMVGFAMPAFGDDSGGNSVYIKQSAGDGLDLTITQTGYNNAIGDENSLITPEFNFDGDNITATMIQDGMNNSITGNIVGSGTTADIEQTGTGNAYVINMGSHGSSDGSLTLKATGNDNTATLNFATTSSATGYNYNANITGDSNALTSTVNSRYVTVDITSTGDNNTINTTQSGFNGSSQNPGHGISITNSGSGNSISVSQDGSTARNSTNVNVSGTNASVSVTQH